MSWLAAANQFLTRHAHSSRKPIYSVQVHRRDEGLPDDDTREMRRIGNWLCVLVPFSRNRRRSLAPRIGFDMHMYPLVDPLPRDTPLVLD